MLLVSVAVFTRGSTDGRSGALNCVIALMIGCFSSGIKWGCVAAVGVAATCTIVGLLRGGTRMDLILGCFS